jgi:hypothetical protein
MAPGRNFDEVLRVLDSLQLLTKRKVATPANWHPGEDVIIAARCLTRRPERSIRKAGERPYLICAWYQIRLHEPRNRTAQRPIAALSC